MCELKQNTHAISTQGTLHGNWPRPKSSLHTQFWYVLKELLQCMNFKIVKECAVLLKDSLCNSPLSKQLISSLLDMVLLLLKLLITSIDFELVLIFVDVCALILMRLYYHHLIGDIVQESCVQLNGLHLLNEDVNALVKNYEELIYHNVDLLNLPILISEICQTATAESGGFLKYDEPKALHPYFLYSLRLWKVVTRKITLNLNDFSYLKQESLAEVSLDNKNWLHYVLALETLSECSIINSKCLKMYLQLGANCGCFSSKKKVKLLTESVSNLSLKKKETLCTLKDGDLTEINHTSLNCNNIVSKWSFCMIAVYLKCLSKVCIAGITTEIQKLALYGGKHYFGLIDYLDCNSSECKLIQKSTYNLLKSIYLSVESNPINESLKNRIFQKLEQFKDKVVKNLKIMTPTNQHVNGILISKIATNLSIVHFVTNFSKVESSSQVKLNFPVAKFENLSVKHISQVERRTPIFIGSSMKPHKKCMKSELRSIVADQYIKELREEDILRKSLEKERETNHNEKREEEKE